MCIIERLELQCVLFYSVRGYRPDWEIGSCKLGKLMEDKSNPAEDSVEMGNCASNWDLCPVQA